MRPEGSGVVFESYAELDVLSAGLEVLVAQCMRSNHTDIAAEAAAMQRFVAIGGPVLDALRGNSPYGPAEPHEHGVLGLNTPLRVAVAKAAVHTCAEPERFMPGIPLDPLVRQTAADMWQGFLAQGGAEVEAAA